MGLYSIRMSSSKYNPGNDSIIDNVCTITDINKQHIFGGVTVSFNEDNIMHPERKAFII